MNVNQRNQTRNQSTADYQSGRIFIFDNRYQEGVFKNNTAGTIELSAGQLIVRDTEVEDRFLPATSSNLADVIGISAYEGSTDLEPNESKNMNICTKGSIEPTMLVLPDGVTLSTTVGNKSLKDVLESLGFHIGEGAVEMTEFDN